MTVSQPGLLIPEPLRNRTQKDCYAASESSRGQFPTDSPSPRRAPAVAQLASAAPENSDDRRSAAVARPISSPLDGFRQSFGTGDAAASDRVRSTPAAIRGLTATGGASPSLRSERDPRCGAMRGALALLRLREGELQDSCKRRCLGAPTEAQGRGRRLRSRLMSPSWSSRRVHSLQGQVSRPEISFLSSTLRRLYECVRLALVNKLRDPSRVSAPVLASLLRLATHGVA